MSTKSTLSYNFPEASEVVPPDNRDSNCPQYHLYEECFEEDGSVYLELNGCEFEASPKWLTVKIPAVIWNRIIKIGERKSGK